MIPLGELPALLARCLAVWQAVRARRAEQAAKERLALEMAKLPKTPVKGQVRLNLDVVEATTQPFPVEGAAKMPK